MLLGRQNQRRSVSAVHHRLKTGFDLQQPMLADLPVYRLDLPTIDVDKIRRLHAEGERPTEIARQARDWAGVYRVLDSA